MGSAARPRDCPGDTNGLWRDPSSRNRFLISGPAPSGKTGWLAEWKVSDRTNEPKVLSLDGVGKKQLLEESKWKLLMRAIVEGVMSPAQEGLK